MAISGKKTETAENVYEMALARCRAAFDLYDRVVVSFSGGKDSTATMQVALTVAREKNRLPLDVFTFDEEAIPPETVEYMSRVATNPEIRFHWYCLPIEHRNACSRKQPYWYCWAPEDRAVWVRDLPPQAITQPPRGFARQSATGTTPLIWGPQYGTVAILMGIRTQESLTRFRGIAVRRGFDAFRTGYEDAPWLAKVYPIYDWTLDDVWLAPERFGWDYNRAYDVMEQAGLTRTEARCSPPYGEQPIRRLWSYQTCWPELWTKMIARVPGAATAARYANTELYGIGVKEDDCPAGMNWREAVMEGLKRLDDRARREVAEGIRPIFNTHRSFTTQPLPDKHPHPVSGFCWKDLYGMVQAGGNKFGRQQQKIYAIALLRRQQAGVDRRRIKHARAKTTPAS